MGFIAICRLIVLSCVLLSPTWAYIEPIETQGRQFVYSVSRRPFSIRGVDYQPGGSSAYKGAGDPLTDIEGCKRDIFLFQQLGINAIRVYTVNPDLNHDECMSLMADAGIYAIFDVNSPRIGESLNRYEPWTTYNYEYLQHIFKVVEQFSGYNNTLGFFAGNEIVNDERSAMNSPSYIKAVIRDVKMYIDRNSPRKIPVGYSAADDLRYRTSLARFLECGDDFMSVDFYGVNSYQWCGHQSYLTSGYSVLVKDYSEYSLPIFLSEYGCNLVSPRLFQEVHALYSPAMSSVFSGGLVYEFTQEPNNYGLVELDQIGNAYLKKDYVTLQEQFASVKNVEASPRNDLSRPMTCKEEYANLNTQIPIPATFGTDMIVHGIPVRRGTYIVTSSNSTAHHIYDLNGKEIGEKSIAKVQSAVSSGEQDALRLDNQPTVHNDLPKTADTSPANTPRRFQEDSNRRPQSSRTRASAADRYRNKGTGDAIETSGASAVSLRGVTSVVALILAGALY